MDKRTFLWLRWVVLAAALCSGCSPTEDEGNRDHGGDGRNDDGGGGDGTSDDGSAPDPGADDGVVPPDVPSDWTGEVCDEIDFEIARVIPDMLIVLDRSNSMAEGYWNPVRDSVSAVAMDMDTEIWFGLMTFPNAIAPRSCAGLNYQCEPASGVLVEVAVGNALAIQTALGALATCGGTPTALTLRAARAYLESLTTGHPGFVLLATDGGPNCNGGELDGYTCRCTGASCILNPDNCLDDVRTLAAIDELRTAGINTYVIGIATTAFWDVMDAMASRGGTTAAFRADDAASIRAAFEDIAGAVATCEFDIGSPSATADPDQVNFYFDGDVVPMDETCTDGWRWVDAEHTRVEFCGPSCTAILSREVDTISARFGCPTILI